MVLFGFILLAAAGLWALPSSTPCNGLSWNANAEPDLGGYKIYWRTDPAVAYTNANSVDVKKVTTIQFDTTIPTVGIALRGQKYYFSVTAYDTQVPPGESGFSNEAGCKRPPAPPANLVTQ
jgi:hypothetical protein